MKRAHFDWVKQACAGAPVASAPEIAGVVNFNNGMIVATDRKRLHLLVVNEVIPDRYEKAGETFEKVIAECQASKYVQIEADLWAPGPDYEGRPTVVHTMEGIKLDRLYYEEATSRPGMRCAVAEKDTYISPVRFSDPLSGAVAYIMPISTGA